MPGFRTQPTQSSNGGSVSATSVNSRDRRWPVITGLILTPPLLLGIARALGWIGASLATHSFVGCAIAAGGGVLTGLAVERFLHRGRNGTEHLVGLALTTALGVLTVGYLYLVHIRGPMSAITTLSRAVSQILIFVEFLTAQAAGVLLTAVTEDKADR
jgi:hypothetical protein